VRGLKPAGNEIKAKNYVAVYRWTQANADAAKGVREGVNDDEKADPKKKDVPDRKVIIDD